MRLFKDGISRKIAMCFFAALLSLHTGRSQDIAEAYSRYEQLESLTRGNVFNGAVSPRWAGKSSIFWYMTDTREGTKFYIVDPVKKEKREAFELNRLGSAFSDMQGKKVNLKGEDLRNLEFSESLEEIRFVFDSFNWVCRLPSYRLERGEPFRERERQAWSMQRRNELDGRPVESPDGKMEAYIRDYNLFVRDIESGRNKQLSFDGGLGHYYSAEKIRWSPDSRKLVTTLVRPAEPHMVHYIESSPESQLQPLHTAIEYYKPGDALPQYFPRIFTVGTEGFVAECDEMIPNQYSIGNPVWRPDSKRVTFEYNKRGHQIYQVIEMDADGSPSRVLIDEQAETFIDYSGKKFRYDVNDGDEIIWASERDGWNHLYLYDGVTGKVKNQITKGEWVVRRVVHVDQEERTILFEAGGREPGDPYLLHLYRINFDGSGLRHLTEGDGNHRTTLSPDRKFIVDTWSRVDLPPRSVVRDAKTGRVVMELEEADINSLLATGWEMPEVFVSKGRDGVTDIWGMILKPSGFDPSKTYPVIEYIYAGPHGNHVPKDFTDYYNRCRHSLTELGFVIVMIDGMGTSNRSKAFQDVCWKNIGDAGFPDRILWIKEAASTRPWMDISRMGIYGKSAGGQNSTGALLFHPEFYKVGVSVCGCHDNRMDKIWWNEQWMGWPVGKEYGESSNVDNAWRLQGDLFLIVGEMDQNVDPASTYQVADALIKANKEFDLLTLPGKGHEWGGLYGERRIVDFFVEKILGVRPPPMNSRDWGKRLIDTDIDR
jgi:dipeptidyl aminopeptidase/acylaminoacyl peptidase